MIDNQYEEALQNIESQLENGYLDITDRYPDEKEFLIVLEAVRLYKEKYSIKPWFYDKKRGLIYDDRRFFKYIL